MMDYIMENQQTGILLADTSTLGNGRILDIGGNYGNKYAIV